MLVSMETGATGGGGRVQNPNIYDNGVIGNEEGFFGKIMRGSTVISETPVYNSDNILIQAAYATDCFLLTALPFDLTDYSYIDIEWSDADYYGTGVPSVRVLPKEPLDLASSTPAAQYTMTTASGSASLDISSLTGEYYIQVYTSNGNRKIKVKSLKLR